MKYRVKCVLLNINVKKYRSDQYLSDEEKIDEINEYVESLRVKDIQVIRFKTKANIPDILRELEIHPFNCLMISDSDKLLELAEEQGLLTLAIKTEENQWDGNGVDFLTDIDIEALLTIGTSAINTAHEWLIVEERLELNKTGYYESVFGLSNGYLGLRGCHEEDDQQLSAYSQRGTFINGFYEYDWEHFVDGKLGKLRISTIFPVCDWTRLHLTLDQEEFSLFSGIILSYKRELDMKKGVLKRMVEWESPKGKRIHLITTYFLSPNRKHNGFMRYSIESVNFTGQFSIRSEADPNLFIHRLDLNGQPEKFYYMRKVQEGIEEKSHYMHYRTNQSQQDVAMVFTYNAKKNGVTFENEKLGFDESVAVYELSGSIGVGENVILDKSACFYTSLDDSQEVLLVSAMKESKDIGCHGFEVLLSETASYWENHWALGDIEIEGNIRDQQAIRYSLFALRQGHPEDGVRSISATGNTGNNYRGHIFWDTEMFMMPYFNYTTPTLAKDLLMYRYHTMDKAKMVTKKIGNPGVRFAWNTIDGTENGNILYAAFNQYHVNCDIVYAIWRYWISTNDREFMYEYGCEMVFEVSKYLFSIGAFSMDKDNHFCINGVCGPDEYHAFSNNNCYTNAMAGFVFRFAVEIYKEMSKECLDLLEAKKDKIKLSDSEVEQWQRASEQMYMPYSDSLGVHMQDDQYLSYIPVDMEKVPINYDLYSDYHWLTLWRSQVSKQADVLLMMFTLGHRFSKKQKSDNYTFYEPRTNHGSSLSPCIHSILAAELGLMDESYGFLEQTIHLDLYDLKGNTKKGLHYACLGGTWMAIVNGIAGMRDYDHQLLFDPQLPKAWKSYSFKIKYRGSLIYVRMDSRGPSFELLSGKPVRILLSGKEVLVDGH